MLISPRVLQLAFCFPSSRNLSRIMSGENEGVPLKEVVEELDKFANPNFAESWDNVGLLVEPMTPTIVKSILLTNDLTEDVLSEALAAKTNFIISYHPPIFAPLKRVTTAHWKERIILSCLENRIAVYSPHTAWDAVNGGVTDWLSKAFKGHFDEYSVDPITNVLTEESQKNDSTKVGMGRILYCKNLTLAKCVELVKQHTGLLHVRLSIARGRNIESHIDTIGLVPGSGGSLLKTLPSNKLDLFVTGEMFHHDVLDAAHNGTSIILTNHSDSERGFLYIMASKLQSIFGQRLSVSVSTIDKDPLKIV